jgi:hypothetical protein
MTVFLPVDPDLQRQIDLMDELDEMDRIEAKNSSPIVEYVLDCTECGGESSFTVYATGFSVCLDCDTTEWPTP